MKKKWEDLSRTEQDLYLTLLWKDGYSQKAIANFFSTTKGRVVGRHNRLKLPGTDRPPTRSQVDPERFRDLLDLHAMEKLEEQGVASIAPVGSCIWPLATLTGKKTALCGKPVVPGHRLCEEHRAKALSKL